jgi:hypothetical protein
MAESGRADSEFAAELTGRVEDSLFGRLYSGHPGTREVMESEHLVAFADLAPLVAGHLLVVPRPPGPSQAAVVVHTIRPLARATSRAARRVPSPIQFVGPWCVTRRRSGPGARRRLGDDLEFELVLGVFGASYSPCISPTMPLKSPVPPKIATSNSGKASKSSSPPATRVPVIFPPGVGSTFSKVQPAWQNHMFGART